MYKDKNKQREVNRERQRRYKAKQKALPEQGVTGGDEALPRQGVTKGVTQEQQVPVSDQPKKVYPLSIPKRGKDIKCKAILKVEPVRRHSIRGFLFNGAGRGHYGDALVYQMTVMERLFYRPASKLKPGETNFISLPGRACYGVTQGRGAAL